MKTSEAVKYFGSPSKLAKALNVSKQSVNYWVNHSKVVPERYAYRLQRLTAGALQVKPGFYEDG